MHLVNFMLFAGRNAELSVNAKTVDGTARVHAASC